MTNPYLNLLTAVWKNGKKWRGKIIGFYFAYIIAQAAMSLSPYAFGRAIDLLQYYRPEKLSSLIAWLSAGVLLVPVFWLFHGPARVVERRVAQHIRQHYLNNIYQRITELPLKWHQDKHSGNLITRIYRSSLGLYQFSQDQYIYIETIIKFLISIGFLLWISPIIGFLSLLACFIATIAVFLFDRKLIPLYEAQNEIDNHVGAGFFDYISNMTTVLTLRLQELTKRNIASRLLAIWPYFRKETVINEIKWFFMGMVLSATQSFILIMYVIHYLKTQNSILIGTVVMIFRYQTDLSEVFYNLSLNYSQLVRMNTDLKGMDPIFKDIKRHAHGIRGAAQAKKWHSIEVIDLSFNHPNEHSNHKTIDHLKFNIKRTEKIALIGPSGAGKSTLLNLLSGLYTASTVELKIDGKHFVTLEPMHAITTLIPQEPELFENTITFNITLDLTATSEDIEKVIRISDFESVLPSLPQGLATDIKEKGLNLSVGQKQRLALARGLFAARFSSIILMDEPTSSLDLQTESLIFSHIMEHYKESTLIVSLHRLHLLPQFDRIILMKNGKIIADGLSEILLKEEGPVKKLWDHYQGRKH